MQMQVVRYGDQFRLRYTEKKRGGEPQYMISAEKGGWQYYPRVGQLDDAVLLRLGGGRPGEPVSHNATVELTTTETVVGEANTIGAFKKDHFLYYQPPGDRGQKWQLQLASGHPSDGKIHAGEDLVFVNREFSDRRMAQDAKEPAYLTIDNAERASWRIELAEPMPLT